MVIRTFTARKSNDPIKCQNHFISGVTARDETMHLLTNVRSWSVNVDAPVGISWIRDYCSMVKGTLTRSLKKASMIIF